MRIGPDRADDLGQFVAHFAKVHSVNDGAGNIVAFRPVNDLLKRSGALDTGAHREKIVLANEDDRELVERSEVQGLVKRTLVDRAVAKKTKGDPVFLTVLRGERHSHGQR